MKEGIKRITTGFVFMVVVIAVLVINNSIVDSLFVTLLSILGIYEYNRCFKAKGHHPVSIIGYLSCLIIPLIGNISSQEILRIILVALPILMVAMFAYIVIKQLKVTIIDVAITFFSILYVPFMFSFIKLLFIQPHGRILVIIAFVCATATDTFAYEIGSRFGKHKLSPVVSPKKSIEGSTAGIIAAMITTGVTCYIANTYFGTEFNIILMIFMGAIFSVVGQIGDLAASSIKRYCEQKDFSHLLPGHGGILDRFDSIMFISPILYVFMYLMNLL
ncbi:MAG: phosphatidate cytidylyltransferase [Clostridia bacterium]